MITVNEVKDESEITLAVEKTGITASFPSRWFVGKEDGTLFGAVKLVYGGGIKIDAAKVTSGTPFEYYDLLVRSALNAVRDLKGQRVYVQNGTDYFLTLGFKKKGDLYEVQAEKIDFSAPCRKNRQAACGAAKHKEAYKDI